MSSGGARKGAGRPKSKTAKRTIVGVRVDAAGRARIKRVARAKGLTVTAWVWDAISKALAESGVE